MAELDIAPIDELSKNGFRIEVIHERWNWVAIRADCGRRNDRRQVVFSELNVEIDSIVAREKVRLEIKLVSLFSVWRCAVQYDIFDRMCYSDETDWIVECEIDEILVCPPPGDILSIKLDSVVEAVSANPRVCLMHCKSNIHAFFGLD